MGCTIEHIRSYFPSHFSFFWCRCIPIIITTMTSFTPAKLAATKAALARLMTPPRVAKSQTATQTAFDSLHLSIKTQQQKRYCPTTRKMKRK
jgi:hypothetical protein